MSDEEIYRIFDPNRVSPQEARVQARLEALDRGQPLTIRGFTAFSMAVIMGFRRINYAAETRESDGAFVWLSGDHARAIGTTLRPSLESLGLQCTTFEPGALEVMAEAVPEGVQIDELIIAHKSADEVTQGEVTGLASLVTRLGTHVMRLWAAEYDPGVLDLLASELRRRENRTLVDADICDISLPEPTDRIRNPAVETFLAANRHG